MPKDGPSIVSNSTASTFGNSPQKTGEPVDRLKIYSGKALEFDGVSDYITANPDFLVNSTATTAMTVAVWVNVDDISSNQDVIAVFDTNQNSKFLGNYNGSISFTMYNNDYSDILGQKTDDVVLVEGQWHRIVATYDGSQTDAGFKIYMDGALIASSASNSIFSANLTTDLTIGRTNRTSGTTNDFAGKMSDFQVWDTVWSLADVTYDYLNPEKLITSQTLTDDSVSNLKVWYPMNDTGVTSPQTVIFDAAGTNNTTKAHGTTTFLGDELITDVNDRDFGSTNDGGTINWVQYDPESTGFTYAEDNSTDDRIEITPTSSTEKEGAELGTSHFTTLVAGRQYRVSAKIYTASGSVNSVSVELGGVVGSTFQITTNDAKRTIDITVTSDAALRIYTTGTETTQWFIDNVSIKEIGIATGWTDADQQQYIPQTAFMDGCLKNNFDGADDYISLGNADSLNNIWDGGGSVSAWIFPTALPSGNGTRILCKKQEGHVGWFIALSDLSGSTCDLNFRIDWDGDNYDINTSNRDITLNQWNHIVVVYNSDSTGNTASIFINGSSKTITSDTPTGTRNDDDNKELRIGGQLNSGGSAIIFPFEGIIDEVAIFNKELSANLDLSLGSSEIALLYNSGQPHNLVEYSKTIKSSSNLIGYFKNNNLNDAGKWKDQISTNHGTINGTPDHIFFQQGATANLCTQGYSNNIVHPSKGSIHFLGQEYAAFPGERIINLDGDFTIEFWFKKTQLHVGSLTDQMLISSGTKQIRIPGSVSSGKMSQITYRDAGVNSSFSIHSDNRKSIYEWSHVVLVKQQGTIKPYIDTVDTGNGTLSSTGQMQIKLIGAYSVAAGQMYKGFLDDLRIYDKALSAAEVAKNYKNGKSQHKNS